VDISSGVGMRTLLLLLLLLLLCPATRTDPGERVY
jgi:hypothetical protein